MKYIPNILTLSNLFCGSVASILMIKDPAFLPIAIILICMSLIFDFFDGFVARAVKASGKLGKQLDSLADVISFGFFPGILMVSLINQSLTESGSITVITETGLILKRGFTQLNDWSIISFLGLFITLFSALRLAIFNIDEEQSYYFKGLNTPTNTIFILSLYYLQQNYNLDLLSNTWALLIITFLFSYLLVSPIPLFGLKFKSFSWKDNFLIYSFLILCIILFILLKAIAIPILVILYIIISIIFKKKIISNGTKTS